MAAKNKFGWHSGVLKCKDAKILRDLYVQDDIVFSDVSAGVLGVTGGIDMTGTVSAIGIDLTGSTCTTAQIAVGTGTSTPQTMAEAEDFAIAIYTTCADTDGANTATPLYVNASYTGAGQVGRAAEFVLRPTAGTLMGGWCNAVKGYTDFSTTSGTGGSTGLASAICAEMRLPKGACSGAFYPLEIEWVGQTSTAFSTPGSGSQSGFIYCAASGTVTDMDADGVFFSVYGLTAGATALLSTNSQTLKCNIGTSTTRYLVLSQATDSLSLDSCATAITLGDNVTTTGIQIGDTTTGILLDGDFTTAINVEATGNTCTRAIMVGAFGQTDNFTLTSARNYPVGVFGRLVATEDTTADVRCGWYRLRVDADVQIGSSANWGSALKGLQGSVKLYGGTTTGTYCWAVAGLFGSIETDGVADVRIKDGCVAAGVFAQAGLLSAGSGDTTIEASGTACGMAINNGAGANLIATGTWCAMYIYSDAGTGLSWDEGILLESGFTTGITIGACTTGLAFTGAQTTCIDFTGATLAPDDSRTNSAIAIGDRDGAHTVTMSGATLHLDPIQINLVIEGTNPSAGSTVNGIYQLITHTDAHMANLRLKCSDWNVVVENNIKDAYVYQGEIDFTTNSVTVGGEAAVMGLVMNCSSTVTGGVSGIVVSMTGGGMPVQSYGLFMNVGNTATLTNGIYMETQGGTTMTYGLNIANAATGTFTNVMRCAGTIAYFLNLDDAGNSGFVTTGGTDCTSSGGTSPGYTIKCVMPDGGDGYIRVWDSA